MQLELLLLKGLLYVHRKADVIIAGLIFFFVVNMIIETVFLGDIQ